ncbi:hypothetical protein [Rothia nasimurium]|uniref:hypothetical protein n=1 Tax=Rothia nasimurium TaxID=85336 RepID=UPI001F23E9AB|nr:hypothetical protein [Rothia nasimurium]
MSFYYKSEFQLNNNLDRINNKSLIPLLEEAWECFTRGLYRQAITSTYTTLIYDLLMKLEYLSSAEEDADAKNLLDLIVNQRRKDPFSSSWENKLLEGCYEPVGLLNREELQDLFTIKNYRNQAAHPSFTWNDEKLSQVSITNIRRETALLCIRYAYDASFSKHPQSSNFEFDSLISELNTFYNSYSNDSLRSIIKNKFIIKLNEKSLLKFTHSLWSICFKVNNEVCNLNRVSNCKILQIFIDEKPELLDSIIENQDQYFGILKFDLEELDYSNPAELITTCRNSRTHRLISFCQENPNLWTRLKPEYMSLLREATKNYFGDNILHHSRDALSITSTQIKLQARYLSRSSHLLFTGDFDKYLQSLELIRNNYLPKKGYVNLKIYNYLDDYDFSLIVKFSKLHGRESNIYSFFITHLSGSLQFDQASTNFEIIAPYFSDFSVQNQVELLLAFNECYQLYRNFRIDSFIKEALDSFNFKSLQEIQSLTNDTLDNIKENIDIYFSSNLI